MNLRKPLCKKNNFLEQKEDMETCTEETVHFFVELNYSTNQGISTQTTIRIREFRT